MSEDDLDLTIACNNLDAIREEKKMSELRNCPFCGFDMSNHAGDIVCCDNSACPIWGYKTERKFWNTRPIEDALRKELSTARAEYNELLYAVVRVFEGESRHQTALRYIREAEARSTQSEEVKEVKK